MSDEREYRDDFTLGNLEVGSSNHPAHIFFVKFALANFSRCFGNYILGIKMTEIEKIFEKIVKENFKHTSYNDYFNGLNYMDIEKDNFIFNLTLEKKDETHFAVIVWGLAHKKDLGKEAKQFHGENYKIITNKISESELKEKIFELLESSFAKHRNNS